jgi:hypothetical protein
MLVSVAALMMPGGAIGAPAAEKPPMAQVTGTVTAVDSKAHTMTVVSGVGYALRVHHISVPKALKARMAQPDSALAQVTPGCVVRVDCGYSGATTVATSVVILRTPSRGQAP